MIYTPERIADWVRKVEPLPLQLQSSPPKPSPVQQASSPPKRKPLATLDPNRMTRQDHSKKNKKKGKKSDKVLEDTNAAGETDNATPPPPPRSPRTRTQLSSARGEKKPAPNYAETWEEFEDQMSALELGEQSSIDLPPGASSGPTPPTTVVPPNTDSGVDREPIMEDDVLGDDDADQQDIAPGGDTVKKDDVQSIGGKSGRSDGSNGPKVRSQAFTSLAVMKIWATPVHWQFCNPHMCVCHRDYVHAKIPQSLSRHWPKIADILVHCEGIVPACVKDDLAEHVRVSPAWFGKTVIGKPEKRVKELEFQKLHDIVRQAMVCARADAHESVWNREVHVPLIKCALRPLGDRFCDIDVCSQKTIKEFTPSFKEAQSAAKIVDFLLAYIPEPRMLAQIQALVVLDRAKYPTINQTTANEATFWPAFVHIETKKGHNDQGDAVSKMTIWVSAYINRMAVFTDGAPCPPVPAVIVYGHAWNLYWFVDGGDRIDVFECEEQMGDSRTILGCYRIITILRYLCEQWFLLETLPWLQEKVLDRNLSPTKAAAPSRA